MTTPEPTAGPGKLLLLGTISTCNLRVLQYWSHSDNLYHFLCCFFFSTIKYVFRYQSIHSSVSFSTAGSCPDGDDWKSFKGHCYYVNSDQLTFREANTYCNSKGAHLVSIQSSLENSFVRSIVSLEYAIIHYLGVTSDRCACSGHNSNNLVSCICIMKLYQHTINLRVYFR